METLDEYCRRYLAFLDVYVDVPIVKYEDLVHDPKNTMSKVCEYLDLPYSCDFEQLHAIFNLTGDSGRRGSVIQPPVPKRLPPDLYIAQGKSRNYVAALERLYYAQRH